jgi:hypothetical protein
MTSLPLFQARTHGGSALEGVGMQTPLLIGLRESFALSSVDVLDPPSLHEFRRLLLVQPRLLAPPELVALDNWVRAGGEVMIFADPLLRWPDEQPLGDPRRPPITSLLDPLMSHWGLTLDHASTGLVERRVLAGKAMIQVAGASRFSAAKGSPCSLAENGLIAYCGIGKGRAVLIADADWVDDRLWTLDPAHPHDARAWTSDTIPVLLQIIGGNEGPFSPSGAWLVSQAALISALRWALGLILLLGVLLARFGVIPKRAQLPDRVLKPPVPDST